MEEEALGPLVRQEQDSSDLTFVSLSSGSCGNCGILTYKDKSILIDAGVGTQKFQKIVKEQGINMSSVQGIFITHDHADHTRAAVRLAHKYQWPIYAAPAVSRALLYHRFASAELSAYLKSTQIGDRVQIGEMSIRSFEVPHDSTQNVGYAVDTPSGRFTLVTDIGKVTETIIEEIKQANYLVFESNYDREMLLSGSYPYYLKERIISGEGHISNHEASHVLVQHLHKEVRFLALCHLSGENNSPELALETLRQTFREHHDWEAEGLTIKVLKRGECSPIYYLGS